MPKIHTFRPNALDDAYLKEIEYQTGLSGVVLMRHIISDYLVSQYGEDIKRKARDAYIEANLGSL